MDRFVIRGGVPLQGVVRISGAKNAALPCLAASLLTDRPVILENLPAVRDIQTTCHLLEMLGASVERRVEQKPEAAASSAAGCRQMVVEARNIKSVEAPWKMVRTMRASTLVLGPLVARFGHARVSLPGGCAIGARPIDMHLKGLEKLGATISSEHGFVEARADRLRGARISFERITVTGTEDLMMAATLAEGETTLENAAREPEVGDLAQLLTQMGAKIEGAGTSSIRIQGVDRLEGARHAVIPDRIEAGTYLAAAGITGGELRIENCRPDHLLAAIEKFREAGLQVDTPTPSSLHVKPNGVLLAADMTTEEYPGVATDLQAQYMALITQASGTSRIKETIFENRFMHAPELSRMGADIRIEGNSAIVRGKTSLTGAGVTASDLRASASLVLAGLVAEGETVIERVYHIDRGYERIEEKLRSVGAQIRRVST